MATKHVKKVDPPATGELPPLPRTGATDDEVAAWVGAAIAALDDTPRKANWKYHALGRVNLAEAVAQTDRTTRVDLRMMTSEVTVARQVAESRDMPVRSYMRRALATYMVAVDGVDPAALPQLLADGLLGPP